MTDERMTAVEEHLIWGEAKRGTVRMRGLAAELARRRLDHREVARRAGVVPETVVSAATGRRRTQIRVARAMAEALGVPLEELCSSPTEGGLVAKGKVPAVEIPVPVGA